MGTELLGPICGECAHKRGWTCPDGLVVTHYLTTCMDCGKKTYCCSAEDWDQTGSGEPEVWD